jgi:FdhD protein
MKSATFNWEMNQVPATESLVPIPISKVEGDISSRGSDLLSIEEPLQVRLAYEKKGVKREKSIVITMRTPGHDFELAAGFLFAEGIIQNGDQVAEIQYSGPASHPKQRRNIVTVRLKRGVEPDLRNVRRNFNMNSSCGICGKASIENLVDLHFPALQEGGPVIQASVIHRLPAALREGQALFSRTGGLHAAALFDLEGHLAGLREDIGRHNALDKLIGHELTEGRVPLSEQILMLSGRSSFELIQKALMAGIPIVASVGAPSSLAVELALRFQMTLLGFVREERFNIYSGSCRIKTPQNTQLSDC